MVRDSGAGGPDGARAEQKEASDYESLIHEVLVHRCGVLTIERGHFTGKSEQE